MDTPEIADDGSSLDSQKTPRRRDPDRIPNNYSSKFQRRVAFYPLVGRPRRLDEVPALFEKFAARRSTWARQLGRVGLFDDIVKQGLVASRREKFHDCRPTFIYVGDDPRTSCGHPTVCPYCYARRAAETWRRIDAAVFPRGGRGGPRYSVTVGHAIRHVACDDYAQDALRDYLNLRSTGRYRGVVHPDYSRKDLFKRMGVAGMLHSTRVEYVPAAARWAVVTTVLVVDKPGQPLHAATASWEKVWHTDECTRSWLVRAVARTRRYPVSLFNMDEPDLRLRGLAACKGRRLVATFGVLYGKGAA